MDNEDSRFALFTEPNAYIQRFDKKERCEPKKVVFQEPYETLPNFYLNNNFRKGDCDCIKKDKEKKCCKETNQDSNCNHETKCNSNNPNQKLGFDIKNILPLLGFLNKNGNTNLSQLVGLLGNNKQSVEMGNPISLISNLFSNKEIMSGVLNLFKGGNLNLFAKNKLKGKEIETTDFEIKNYTKVD